MWKRVGSLPTGQSLVALAENGVDNAKRIIGAAGYDPVLPTIAPDQVDQFRKQVEVLDWTGEEDPGKEPNYEELKKAVAKTV